jgi:dolichol kinase
MWYDMLHLRLTYCVLLFLVGPIFICTWPMFGNTAASAMWASLVPLCMTIKFILIGLGVLVDHDAVSSVSRTGDRTELLKGPLYYGIAFTGATYLYWKQGRALICFMTLCFGDGMAELIGRAYGRSNRLPWSALKSWAGSGAFIASSIAAILLAYYLIYSNYPGFEIISWSYLLQRALVASVASALVESLHTGEVDNLWITGVAAAVDTLYCKW